MTFEGETKHGYSVKGGFRLSWPAGIFLSVFVDGETGSIRENKWLLYLEETGIVINDVFLPRIVYRRIKIDKIIFIEEITIFHLDFTLDFMLKKNHEWI